MLALNMILHQLQSLYKLLIDSINKQITREKILNFYNTIFLFSYIKNETLKWEHLKSLLLLHVKCNV